MLTPKRRWYSAWIPVKIAKVAGLIRMTSLLMCKTQ